MNRRDFFVGLGAFAVVGQGWNLKASEGSGKGPVIIEAGRRVDAPGAESPRFPPSKVSEVKNRIAILLHQQNPTAVVSSAACGADLLLLEAANQMNIDRFVLLPTVPKVFRKSSVTDRPGNWGEIYDRVLKRARVKVLHVPEGQEGYLKVNLKLLDEGQQLAVQTGVPSEALVIWNGTSRGPDDVTAHFLKEATLRKINVIEISTL